MDLRGRIDLFGVANIFQLLHQAEATGKLVLEGEDQRGRVYFHQGSLIYARTDADVERIGDLLVRKGALEPAQLEGAKIQADRRGVRIGTVLVESGGLEDDVLAQAIKDQIMEVVYHLVRIDRGSFAFYSQIYPENEDILLDVSLDLLLLEGLRKLDELEHFGPEGRPADAGPDD
ncbi:MAG TPA: DUF4388 domain-containing protein [Candidatus Krumholzibacteria bacterium]|nr:DUF4388 domain-containing protein [Candidatus Krumholzibacteria bacterium]